MQGWTIEVGGGGSDSFVDDSTKRVNSPSYASASLAVGIDENNDGVTDKYYVYEPYWQTGGVQDGWQTWNVLSGKFWVTGSGTTEPSYVVGCCSSKQQ